MKPALLLALALLSPVAAHAADVPAADPLFDMHVHIWKDEASVQEYLAQVKDAGLHVDAYGALYMAYAGEVEKTRAKNDALFALAKRHPGLMPVGSVHPYDGDAALAEVDRLAGLGAKAIKIHALTQKFDAADPRVLALVTHAGERGLVVMMDNANIVPGDSEKLFDLALKAPKTRFVFAHMGGLNFRFWNILPLANTAKDLLSGNMYFDISATVTLVAGSPVQDEFVWTMRNIGIDNLLLGSDFPQLTLKQAVDALDRLGLTEEEKRKIRWGNAQRLFGLPAPVAPAAPRAERAAGG